MRIYISHPDGWKLNSKLENVIPLNFSKINNGGTEYDLFKKKYNEEYEDCWGILSWKFDIKSPVPLKNFYQFCIDQLNNGADCVFINPMILNEALFVSPWEQGVVCGHKGLGQIYYFLLEKGLINENILGINHFAFCNFFVAKNSFWCEYFSYVDKILNLLLNEANNQTLVGKVFSGSASYNKNKNLSMQPFIVERLFSSFINNESSLKVVSYKFLEEDYLYKFGKTVGIFSKIMSDLKNEGLKNSDKNKIQGWHDRRLQIIKDQNLLYAVFNMDDPNTKFIEILK